MGSFEDLNSPKQLPSTSPAPPKHLPTTATFGSSVAVATGQAFNRRIATWAVQQQRFGGPDFKPERMTWTLGLAPPVGRGGTRGTTHVPVKQQGKLMKFPFEAGEVEIGSASDEKWRIFEASKHQRIEDGNYR